MKDISEFSAVNNIYSDFFSHHQPARAAFQVAALPKEGDIEIEAVAIIGEIKLSQLAFQELYFIFRVFNTYTKLSLKKSPEN